MVNIIGFIIFVVSGWFDDVRKESRKYILGERFYKTRYFHDRVERVLIDDHNVPRLR